MKKAIITGIGGQDGAFLAEYLLNKGYRVIGADRRRTDTDYWRLRDLNIYNAVELTYFDLLEYSNIFNVIKNINPDEIYNLAAQSFVKASFEQPVLTSNINSLGPLRILESIRALKLKTKFYQASTSEMFGKIQNVTQSEDTPFYPRSPYGVSKLYAHWIVKNYREAYDMFNCSGILFNHESEFRGSEFVTKKIIESVAKIKKGNSTILSLGNLDAKRDWGYAKDYVEGMYLMMQHKIPDDYVLATGVTTTIRKFVEIAFSKIDIILEWKGNGLDEVGIDTKSGKILVDINPKFFRPSEVDVLIGNFQKAKETLSWEPKVDVENLITIMLNYELKK